MTAEPLKVGGELIELRKSRRYRVPAPASFLWEGPDGYLQQGKGTIRDISDRGVYVLAEVVPPQGAHLDVDVHLPWVELRSAAVHLHGEGTVVRVDLEPRAASGFAAIATFQTAAPKGPTLVGQKLH